MSDEEFVSRLREAYDQHPPHRAPHPGRTPAVAGSSGLRVRGRRALAIGTVVALAAAVPVVATVLADRDRPEPGPAVAATPTPGAPPACGPEELDVRVGGDRSLPGDRRGRLVRLTTRGDGACRIDDPVRVVATVGPRLDPATPERSTSARTPGDRFVVGPGRDVAMMVSSAQCSPGTGFEGADPDSVTRFTVEAGVSGAQVGTQPGTVGTCGRLAVDWVVQEGYAPTTADPYALTGRISVPGGLVVGARSRVVATIRNPTDVPRTVSACALRVLPGAALVVPEQPCDRPPVTVAPGEVRQRITRQLMGDLAGTSFTFTVDGVAAPVRTVSVQRGQ